MGDLGVAGVGMGWTCLGRYRCLNLHTDRHIRLTCVDVNVSVANVNVDVDFNVSVYVCVLSVYTLVQQLVSHCCQTGPGFSP